MSRYSRKVICTNVTTGRSLLGGARKEQAGFPLKRSTTEQIFILRNILEQANEWRAGLYAHFLDFEKRLKLYTEKAYGTS